MNDLKPEGAVIRQKNEKALGGAIMKKTIVVTAIITVMTLLAGCGSMVQQDDPAPASPTQTEEIVLTEAKPEEPAPVPEIVLTDLPDDVEIPDFYSEVFIPGAAQRAFAFIDNEGNTQLRSYGEVSVPLVQESMDTGSPDTDAEASESIEASATQTVIAGFVPVVAIQTGEDAMDEPVYSIEIKDGAHDVVQPADEAVGTGIPTDPDDNVVIPDGFEPVDGTVGLFTYSPAEDEVYYFAYCVFTSGEGKFYPADENGAVVPGVLPVTLDAEGNILVILNVDGEIIYTSVVDSGLAENPAVEDEISIDDEPVIDSENTTKDDEKPDSKQDNKPAATQKPESKPDSGSVSGSDPEPEDDDSQQGDIPIPPQPEPTPDTGTVEDEEDEIIVDPYADCTLVGRVVCNTCGADITKNVDEHGKWHMIERDENFSYREQTGYKFPDGHIEWFG